MAVTRGVLDLYNGIAINDVAYSVAWEVGEQACVEVAPDLLVPRQDLSEDISENKLDRNWWRSQRDWAVGGAGATRFDGPSPTDSASGLSVKHSAFSSNKGTDTTVLGELKLLPATSNAVSLSNNGQVMTATDSAVYVAASSPNLKSFSALDGSDAANISTATETAGQTTLDLTTDGGLVYAAQGADGIHRATSGTDTSRDAFNTSAASWTTDVGAFTLSDDATDFQEGTGSLKGVTGSNTLSTYVGSFTKINTVATQAITGVGFTPKAIIFWTSGSNAASGTWDSGIQQVVGFAGAGPADFSVAGASEHNVATSNADRRMAAKAITLTDFSGALAAEGDVQSFDADGFTLDWTTNSSAGNLDGTVINFTCLAGAQLSAKVLNWSANNNTDSQSVTGVGFKPDLVFHASNNSNSALPATTTGHQLSFGAMNSAGEQWTNGVHSADAQGASDTQRHQSTDGFLAFINTSAAVTDKNAYVSMDPDGFTVQKSTNGGAYQVVSLCLSGVTSKLGSFAKSATAPAPVSQSVTGVGFQPTALMFSTIHATASGAATGAKWSMGASDGTSSRDRVAAQEDIDASTPTFAQSVWYSGKSLSLAASGVATVAHVTSMDSDGFSLSWTSIADNASSQFLYAALAPVNYRRISKTFAAIDFSGANTFKIWLKSSDNGTFRMRLGTASNVYYEYSTAYSSAGAWVQLAPVRATDFTAKGGISSWTAITYQQLEYQVTNPATLPTVRFDSFRSSTQGAFSHWSDADARVVHWGKDQVFALGFKAGSSTQYRFIKAASGAGSTEVTTLPDGWVGSSITSQGAYVYYGAYRNNSGVVYVYDGTNAPTVAWTAPAGEQVIALGTVPQGGLLVSTRRVTSSTSAGLGVLYFATGDSTGHLTAERVATIGSDDGVDYAIKGFTTHGDHVYFTWPYADGSSSGLGVYLPAYGSYARHLHGTVSGTVADVVVFKGRRIFTIDASGVWVEQTTYNTTGTLTSSVMDWNIDKAKMLFQGEAGFLPLAAGEQVQIEYSTDGGTTWTSVATGSATGATVATGTIQTSARQAQYRLTLTAGTSQLTTPTVKKAGLSATYGVKPLSAHSIWLRAYDHLTLSNGTPAPDSGKPNTLSKNIESALRTLRNAQTPVSLQLPDWTSSSDTRTVTVGDIEVRRRFVPTEGYRNLIRVQLIEVPTS